MFAGKIQLRHAREITARALKRRARRLLGRFDLQRLVTEDHDQPLASLTVQLYNYAIAPYDDWHRQAWAAALVLMSITLTLNMTARLVGGRRTGARP